MKTMVSKTPITPSEYRAYHINRIVKAYPDLRQASKSNTFALQYAGTPLTLSRNGGFSTEEANQIYENYHKAYVVSKAYADGKKQQACLDGFVDVAFGLRVRTPLLSKVLLGKSSTPREAEAEARTVGNALSQSYGLLNNRACNEFMQKVWNSPYANDIKPVAMIHDAIYLMFRDDIRVVEWVNRELIKSMQWQELPEIQHDTVKIGAALDIFYPSWADDVTLPNEASDQQIVEICREHASNLKEAA